MGASKELLHARPAAQRTRLAQLQPVGEVFVNGLASSYDDAFPADSALEAYVSRDEFAKATATINEALLDHWPCLPCTSFAYGCCVCTLGLSFYCASSQVREAESRVQLQLRRINAQTNFASRGVEWRLERKWYCRSSSIEIWHVVPSVDAAATSGDAASGSSVDSEPQSAGAMREEVMADRVE